MVGLCSDIHPEKAVENRTRLAQPETRCQRQGLQQELWSCSRNISAPAAASWCSSVPWHPVGEAKTQSNERCPWGMAHPCCLPCLQHHQRARAAHSPELLSVKGGRVCGQRMSLICESWHGLKEEDLFVTLRQLVRQHEGASEELSCRSDTGQTSLCPYAGFQLLGSILGKGFWHHCWFQAPTEREPLEELELLGCQGCSPRCHSQSAGEGTM